MSASYEHYIPESHFLIGGGVQYQYSMLNYGDKKNGTTTSIGVHAGKSLNEKITVIGEYYKLKDYSVPGVTAQYYISEVFGLTLGIKKIVGIDNY